MGRGGAVRKERESVIESRKWCVRERRGTEKRGWNKYFNDRSLQKQIILKKEWIEETRGMNEVQRKKTLRNSKTAKKRRK